MKLLLTAMVLAIGFTSIQTTTADAQTPDRFERPGRPGGPGGPGGGPGRPGGPGGGGGGWDRPDRPDTRQDYFGTTGLVGKWSVESRDLYVGARRGAYRALSLRARDDDFEMQRVTIYFANGGSQRVGAAKISENQTLHINLNGRDRFIETIVVEGKAGNPFGSKAQLEVWGAR